jgi:hypothetical protein
MRWEREPSPIRGTRVLPLSNKNWLDYICAQKERTLRSMRIKAMTHAARVEWATASLKRRDRGVL